jgi:hypothetical protein
LFFACKFPLLFILGIVNPSSTVLAFYYLFNYFTMNPVHVHAGNRIIIGT